MFEILHFSDFVRDLIIREYPNSCKENLNRLSLLSLIYLMISTLLMIKLPNKILRWFAFISLLFLLPFNLHAECDCQTLNGKEAYDQADIIFVGKVIGLETNWMSGGWKFSFEVEKSWKTQTNKFYIVNTAWEKDCGYIFEEGKSYLVYVRRKFTPKTDKCKGNLPLEEAKMTIEELGEAMTPAISDQMGILSILVTVLTVLGMAFLAFVVLRKKNN